MRIGIDMLADQSAGRLRGTGRYTRGLVNQLLSAAQHEIVLYYYEGLPRGDLQAGAPNARLLSRGNSLPAVVHRLADDNPDGLDLLLLTCPLENFAGNLPPFPTRRGARLAAIVYDLIPLRFPSAYLAHPGIAASYRRAWAALRHYDLLLTISASARQDIADFSPAGTAPVVNIGAASDADFFRPPAARPDSAAARWLGAQGIHKPFVYASAAPDFRKNLAGLLAAWQCLPDRLRQRFQCVITCRGEAGEWRRQAAEFVAAGGVVFTAGLDDDQLRFLYQQAAAFVFPSRYEGFGLPLLEAMQCGAAVVAGRNSSQIEVVGDAGLLADVDDPADLAANITRLLEEPTLAEELRRRAVRQAQRFRWPEVGRRCLAAIEGIRTAPRRSSWLGVWAERGRLAMDERRRFMVSRRAG